MPPRSVWVRPGCIDDIGGDMGPIETLCPPQIRRSQETRPWIQRSLRIPCPCTERRELTKAPPGRLSAYLSGMAHSAGGSPFCWCADAKDAVTTTWSNCKIVAALRNHGQSWTAGLAGTLCERYFGRHEPADQSPDDYQSMLRLTGNVTEPSRSGPCPLAAPVLDPRAIVSLVGAPSRTAFGVHGTRFGRRRSDLCRGNIAWWGAPAPGVSSDGRVLRRVCARRQAARLGCFRVASGVLRASTAKLLIP